MSVKQNLRTLVPPTSRFFEQKIAELEGHLERVSLENEQLKRNITELRELVEEGMRAANTTGDAVAALGVQLRAMERRDRYVDGEYLRLSPEEPGRVLLAGWYGADNFGDELMMRTVIECFPREALDRVYVLLWDNPHYDRWGLNPAVHVIHYPRNVWDLEALADRFDTLVWGGGAIIDDGQFDHDPDNYNTGNLFIRLSELMLGRGKCVYALGLSTNDRLGSAHYAKRLSQIISACELFSVRDPYSIRVIGGAGVDVSSIVRCEDLAFCNQGLRKLRAVHCSGSGRRLGVVLLCIEDQFEHNLALICSLAANMRLRDDGYSISLIPFLYEDEWDAVYFRRLLERVPNAERIEVEEYTSHIENSPIVRCSHLVSYKYHATLIADVLGIPNLSVCCDSHPHYRNKMTHLADLACMRDRLYTSSDLLGKVDEAIDILLGSPKLPEVSDEMMEEEVLWLKETCRMIAAAEHD